MYASSTGWTELALDLQGDNENPQELTVPKESKEGSERNAFHLELQDSFLHSFFETAGGKGHHYHLCPLFPGCREHSYFLRLR